MLMIGNLVCNFRRRIVSVVETCPVALLNIAQEPPHVDCALRRTLAAHVLDTADNELDLVARLLKNTMPAELRQMRDLGVTSVHLHAFMSAIRRVWRATTQ